MAMLVSLLMMTTSMNVQDKPKMHLCKWFDGNELGGIRCKRMIPDTIRFCDFHWKRGMLLKTPARQVADKIKLANVIVQAKDSLLQGKP
ncbi:MAG: hypothetical protein Q8M08_16200 [Bacteroidales bacterium]|nr:hypothetical protein [Bacteroidales bacterium]